MAFFKRKYDPAMMREVYIDTLELAAKKKAKMQTQAIATENNTVIEEEKIVDKVPAEKVGDNLLPTILEVEKEKKQEIEKPEITKTTEDASDLVIYRENPGKNEVKVDIDEPEEELVLDEEEETEVKNEWLVSPEAKTAQQVAFEEISCYINNKYVGKPVKKVKVSDCESEQKDDGKTYEKYDVTVSTAENENVENSDDFHFIYEKITARQKEGKLVKKEKITVTRRFTVLGGEKPQKDIDSFEIRKEFELNK